jgi:DNA-binding NarL/FixJ family response regulator
MSDDVGLISIGYFRLISDRCADDHGLAVTYNREISNVSNRKKTHPIAQIWAGRSSGLVTAIRVTFLFKARVQVGIGADICAARVVHILTRDEALTFGGREWARSAGECEHECECGLGEHGGVSCLSLSLTPSWCVFASCWRAGGRVNPPDVLLARSQKGCRAAQKCLSLRDFLGLVRPEIWRCFGPGNEVLFVDMLKEADNMKILLVDDHVLIREALRGVLKEVKGDATVLEASSCSQAMQVIAERPDLDLILLDLNLPDRDGFSVLTELGERYPAISVVVLSAQQDRGSVVRALDLGAVGFIPKSGQREVMLSALQLVFAGGIYIPPEILAREQPSARQSDGKQPAATRPSVSPADLGLTERQVDVLSLMMQGKSNKAICRVLNLAEPTVKNHVTAILKALEVSNRTEAVIAVGQLGWQLPQVSKS